MDVAASIPGIAAHASEVNDFVSTEESRHLDNPSSNGPRRVQVVEQLDDGEVYDPVDGSGRGDDGGGTDLGGSGGKNWLDVLGET